MTGVSNRAMGVNSAQGARARTFQAFSDADRRRSIGATARKFVRPSAYTMRGGPKTAQASSCNIWPSRASAFDAWNRATDMFCLCRSLPRNSKWSCRRSCWVD